jgi:hypothetical protein
MAAHCPQSKNATAESDSMCEECEASETSNLTSAEKRKLINAYWRRPVSRPVDKFIAQPAALSGMNNNRALLGQENRD